MVKLLLCLLFFNPNTELLVTAPGCPPCKKAEAIIIRLQAEGYDVEIVSSKKYKVSAVPTLIVRTDNKTIFQITGLQSEQKYRSLITKSIDDFTGSINFTVQGSKTLLYMGIVRRAKKSRYDYLECNPDNRPGLVKQFKINKLPTLLILKNGKELGRYVGIIPYIVDIK